MPVLIVAVILGSNGWVDPADTDGEADSACEGPRVYLTGLAGGGLGLSCTTFTTTGPGASGRSENSTLACQAGGGLVYHVAPWLVLDVRYQYADLGEPSVELRAGGVRQGGLDPDIGTCEAVGGVRFALPSR